MFAFFTEDARWASWWGPGSTIDPRPGGRVVIRYPNGVDVHGEVVDVDPPRRIAFTCGYASGTPIPAGGSLVTIALEPAGDGTRLHLTQGFAEPGPRDQHVQGWRFQLSLFANAVADHVHAGAAPVVDGWFAAWNEPDPAVRQCQGMVLVEWVATDAGGQPRARGTNVFTLDADTRIASVTGFGRI